MPIQQVQDKQKIIIFDFMRTLYDPERKSVMNGAQELLEKLSAKGFALFLVSTENKTRIDLIKRSGIAQFFTRIIFTPKKTSANFIRLMHNYPHDPKQSFVVGDRVRGEIKIGNLCGYQTIWIQNGKFRSEVPRSANEVPDYIVFELKEIMQLIG